MWEKLHLFSLKRSRKYTAIIPFLSKKKKSDRKLGPIHTYPDIFESATFSFRIQKFPRPHVAKISGFAAENAGCVWSEAVSGKKKLRIQKYPDTCGP